MQLSSARGGWGLTPLEGAADPAFYAGHAEFKAALDPDLCPLPPLFPLLAGHSGSSPAPLHPPPCSTPRPHPRRPRGRLLCLAGPSRPARTASSRHPAAASSWQHPPGLG
eukprot:1299463-Rhodomonas_salina.1